MEPRPAPVPGKPDRIVEVDGLRALAMTMVMAQHCGLLPFGWTGVWLFYVVSGFVITRTLMAEPDTAPAGTRLRLFMLRRALRIMPVYLFYIALNLPFVIGRGSFDALHDLPFLLSFTYNWQMIYAIWPSGSGWPAFGHLWTISVEEQFYLVYPLLFLFLPRRAFVASAACLVVLGPLVRLGFSELAAAQSGDIGWRAFSVYASSVCQFDIFMMGALLAMAEGRVRARPVIARRLMGAAVCVAAAYVGVYVGVNALVRGDRGVEMIRNVVSGNLSGQAREVFVYSVVALLAVAVIAGAIAGWRVLRPFASRPLVAVGRVSYGGYLYHLLALVLLGPIVNGLTGGTSIPARLALLAVVWCVSIACAALSYRLFERRFVGVGHAVSRRMLKDPHRGGLVMVQTGQVRA